MVGWNLKARLAWEASTKSLSMRVDPELHADVTRYAKAQAIPVAEAARTLMEIGLETVKGER